MHWTKIGKIVQNAVNLSKISFLALNSFMHIYNMSVTIPAKYQMNILKALGEIDFTKYAVSPISQYSICALGQKLTKFKVL